jgi:hypothetical protein
MTDIIIEEADNTKSKGKGFLAGSYFDEND